MPAPALKAAIRRWRSDMEDVLECIADRPRRAASKIKRLRFKLGEHCKADTLDAIIENIASLDAAAPRLPIKGGYGAGEAWAAAEIVNLHYELARRRCRT
jgi:hypothetical protein